MSNELRNSLWNVIIFLYGGDDGYWCEAARLIAQYFRKSRVDELPGYPIPCRNWIKDYFFKLDWAQVYNLIEFIVPSLNLVDQYSGFSESDICGQFNAVFAEEMSGYRFIDGQLAPISNPEEVSAVEQSLETTLRVGLKGAHEHIASSLKLLSKKPHPDYRNSIKESISAVESISKQLGSPDSQGLAGALNNLGAKVGLHGALKAGFLNLYGYTSDADGIRHALLDEPNVGFDEAKYMLVACSAFVNYLAAKAGSVASR